MSELEGDSVAVAYELKAPLALIRQLSLQLEIVSDPTMQKEIIDRIRLTSERSLRLADSVIKTRDLEDALFELEPIHVSKLCKDVIDELTPLAKARCQFLSGSFARRPLLAVGNSDLLKSLLVNLTDNAIQHGNKGSKVEVFNYLKNGEAIISIRDYNETVDIGDFRKLKESIGRKVSPISTRPMAPSLSLFTSQKLLEAMNGSLSVKRHNSGGVTFSAHLPLSRQLSLLES